MQNLPELPTPAQAREALAKSEHARLRAAYQDAIESYRSQLESGSGDIMINVKNDKYGEVVVAHMRSSGWKVHLCNKQWYEVTLPPVVEADTKFETVETTTTTVTTTKKNIQ